MERFQDSRCNSAGQSSRCSLAGHCARRAMDLARLGRKCFVSQNALGEILTWAKQNPDTLAELGTSRASIKRAREDACDILTSYGKLLQEMSLRGKNGNGIKVAYLAPAAMLQHAASSCEKFGQCLGKVLEGRLSSLERPYTIVIHSDEVSPGNQLKHTNRRETPGSVLVPPRTWTTSPIL